MLDGSTDGVLHGLDGGLFVLDELAGVESLCTDGGKVVCCSFDGSSGLVKLVEEGGRDAAGAD